jgi:hypothetical protein
MENYLNILHYFVYKAHYKSHVLFNKLNPFRLIHKLPFQKRRYEELGIDIDQEVNKAFGDKDGGLSVMVSGGVIVGIVFFLILSLVIILKRTLKIDLTLEMGHFIFIAVLAIIPCYFWVFKKDKYLAYFRKYESWSRTERMKYGWISVAFILFVILLFFGSFIL